MVDASSADLLAELNAKRRKMRLLPLVTVVAIGLGAAVVVSPSPAPVAAVSGAALLLLLWLAHQRDQIAKTTVILYDLDQDAVTRYQQLHDSFDGLCSCSRVWHVSAQGEVRDRKYHAGAGAVVRRTPVTLRVGAPPYVRTNVAVPLVPVGRQTLAFMPDRLLVFESSAVGAVSYPDLNVGMSSIQFVEDGGAPTDATISGRTWRYVNKKGGPDRRFRDNPELPVCTYDEIHFSSASGLDEVLQLSRTGSGSPFAQVISNTTTQ
jgi:hypothetical protein